MNDASTVAAGVPEPTIRHMRQDELPGGLLNSHPDCRIDEAAEQSGAGCTREWVGWVAEVQGHLAGYVICTVIRPRTAHQAGFLGCLAGLLQRLVGGRGVRPLHVELLGIVMPPETCSKTAERILVGRLVEDLQHLWRRVPVVVVESNLTAQLLLRDAGYRAVRVMRGYYGEEDGYLMSTGEGASVDAKKGIVTESFARG